MRRPEPICIREFQFLVPKAVDRSDCRKLTQSQFAALREFVLANRGDGDNPLELMRLCALPGVGEAIQAQNYVGMVELRDGLQIEVLPKIDTATDSQEMDEKKLFLRMLASLGGDVPFKQLEASRLSSRRMPLFEVFVAMFLREASDLVRHGLKSAYATRESEEQLVRGKIDFARELKKNPAHAERMNVIYDEFVTDCPENRLVKTTLLYLRRVSHSHENMRLVARLLNTFDEIDVSHNVDAAFARCVTDRSTRSYETLLAWCRVFLKGESFTMFRGSSVANALLFPMERVFEDYVGKSLRREARRSGAFKVELQARGEWLFENHRAPLRPDILCTRPDGARVVMDTKWKRMYGIKDLSTADLYQMYAYGQRYRGLGEGPRRVVLLYPWHEGLVRGLDPQMRHVSKDGVQVDAFFVDLANMKESVEGLMGLIGEHESRCRRFGD